MKIILAYLILLSFTLQSEEVSLSFDQLRTIETKQIIKQLELKKSQKKEKEIFQEKISQEEQKNDPNSNEYRYRNKLRKQFQNDFSNVGQERSNGRKPKMIKYDPSISGWTNAYPN